MKTKYKITKPQRISMNSPAWKLAKRRMQRIKELKSAEFAARMAIYENTSHMRCF